MGLLDNKYYKGKILQSPKKMSAINVNEHKYDIANVPNEICMNITFPLNFHSYLFVLKRTTSNEKFIQ